MPATSTVLFPEGYAAVSFSEEPLPGQLAVGDGPDTGAEQVAERRSRPLMRFSWRSEPLDVAGDAAYQAFVDQCGSGATNFTFYRPYSKFYTSVLVGYTDGTDALVVPFRNLNSWTSIKVDGSSDGGASVSNEFVSPTKEDKVITLTGPPAADLPITLENVYGRQRFICRMLSWRRSLFQDGFTEALAFDPLSTTVPLMYAVYEFSFREKNG
ncbi:MAG TPA: hypothetical protein PLB01_00345 [Thermoanaerobaculia bacterium]|nr:hypothetical protein [Thermoanaerobaculia bacterium]